MICINKNDPGFIALKEEHGIEGFVLETLIHVYYKEENITQQTLNTLDEVPYPSNDFIITKLKDDPAFRLQEEAKNQGYHPKDVKKIFPGRKPKDVIVEVGTALQNVTPSKLLLDFVLGINNNTREHTRFKKALGNQDAMTVLKNLNMTKKYSSEQPEYWLKKIIRNNQNKFEKFYQTSLKATISSKLDIEKQESVEDYFLRDSAKKAIYLYKELRIAKRRLLQGYFNLNTKDARYKKITKQLDELEKQISFREYDLGIINFVKDFNVILKNLEENLKKGQINTAKRIQYLSEIISFYRPMLLEIKDYLEERPSLELQSNGKLESVLKELDIDFKLNKPKANQKKLRNAIVEMIGRMETLNEAKKRKSRETVVKRAIEYVNSVITDEKTRKEEIEKIRKYTTRNDYDDNAWNLLFGSLAKSKDVFLRIFDSIMRDVNFEVQTFTYNLAQEVYSKAAALGIDKTTFYKKVTDPNDKHSFISPYDWATTMQQESKEFKKLHKDLGLSLNREIASETRKLWSREMKMYFVFNKKIQVNPNHYIYRVGSKISFTKDANNIPAEAEVSMKVSDYLKSDIYLDAKKETEYSQAVRAIKQKYYVDSPRALEIIEENKRKWGANSIRYKYWFNENVGVDRAGNKYFKNELLVPKKKNPEYDNLSDNEKEFLEYLMEIKREADSKIPFNTNLQRKPQIKSDWVNSVFKKGSIREAIREGFNFTKDADDTLFGGDPVIRADGSYAYSSPTHFIQKVENPDSLTTDVIGSIVLYAQMAENAERKREVQPEYETLLETLQERQTNIKGARQRDKETVIVQRLINFMKSNLYGMHKEESIGTINIFGVDVSVEKLSVKLGEYIRSNNLAARWVTAAVGAISSTVNFNLEKVVGARVSKGASSAAMKIYFEYVHLALAESGAVLKKNKLSRTLQSHFVLQNIDEMFSHTDVNNRISRKLSIEKGYFVYPIAEHGIKSNIMLSVMSSFRLHEGKFVKQEALEKQGVAWKTLPTYWESLNEEGTGFKYNVTDAKLEKTAMHKRVRSLINEVDGRLSVEDRSAAHRHFLLNHVTTHRSWLFKGIEKRLHPVGYNYEAGLKEGGYWAVTGQFMKEVFTTKSASLKHGLAMFKELDAYEQEAIKRTLYEMLFTTIMVTLGTLVNALANSDDDDEDYKLFEYMALITTRVYLEFTTLQIVPVIGFGVDEDFNPKIITSLMPPIANQLFEIVDSPVVGVDQINNLMDLADFMNLGKEVQSGPYEGMTRFQRLALKSFPGGKGITADLDPKSSRNYLINNVLTYW